MACLGKPIAPSRSHPTRDGWIEICIITHHPALMTCPIPHGMGGLKLFSISYYCPRCSRPIPHGMGGLKFSVAKVFLRQLTSHPTRDGWIEMPAGGLGDGCVRSPIPHGMGGLKCLIITGFLNDACPIPHGMGGLKYRCISHAHELQRGPIPHGMGGLKCMLDGHGVAITPSHPTRDGWIEILLKDYDK